MRPVTINMASGADQSVDPRIAPNGTIARVQDMRIDKQGRLVIRDGYTSLGTTVQDGSSGALVPFDLHNVSGALVCLGHNSQGTQTGIRAIYRYLDNVQGDWRTEAITGSRNGIGFVNISAADSVQVVTSEPNSLAVDEMVASVAITDSGAYVGMVSTDGALASVSGQQSRLTIVDANTGLVAGFARLAGIGNALVLAIGDVFYVVGQVMASTEISVFTFNMGSASPTLSAATVIATGCSPYPCPFDVSVMDGSTDYLLAFATAAGYTMRRFNSANTQQTTTNVATLAACPVSICGESGQRISVLNKRAVQQVEYRSFLSTTGALSIGPTVLGTANLVSWVSIQRATSTTVLARWMHEVGARTVEAATITPTTGGSASGGENHAGTRPMVKPIFVDGLSFVLETLGTVSPAPYALAGVNSSSSALLHAVMLDGLAKITYSAATMAHVGQMALRAGTKQVYAALIALDPRDGTYRANLVRFELFSGKRRQGVSSGNVLYLAGGITTQWDMRVSGEVGVETAPDQSNLSQAGGGGLTLLGVYTYQLVYRYVDSNGDVTQSAPSSPLTVTMTAANNRTNWSTHKPYGQRAQGINGALGVDVFLDVYRTEAGGSIPRLVQSKQLEGGAAAWGGAVSVQDNATDAVAQAGSPLYTQGADGSVSGRLPLGLASPAGLICESDGKLILGQLERNTHLHLSIENRPGEAAGFVNDDLFFIQNPEPVTAIASVEDGRRLIWSAGNIRELVGTGPNAAGVGDISEPVEIENRIGCSDWRGVVKTEHGVFFPSASTGVARIYLMPRGGSGAIDASEGIHDVLQEFPIVTSATRHDAEQLLTFTLQNAAGTDGRIIHLDLKTSGMDPRRGWRGLWFVDRVPVLEGVPDIQVVSEAHHVFPAEAGVATTEVPLPKAKRVGDRLVVFLSGGTSAAMSAVVSANGTWTVVGNAISIGSGVSRVVEMVITTTTMAQQAGCFVIANSVPGTSTSLIAAVFLLRYTDPAQASAFTGVSSTVSGTSSVLPLLTPSWGVAKTLWLSMANADNAVANETTAFAGYPIPVWRSPPVSLRRFAYASTREGTDLDTYSDQATASLIDAVASKTVTWGNPSVSTTAQAMLVAVKPLSAVAAASPVRASVQWQNRLVICNSTDVLASNPNVQLDQGNTPIQPEWESCDVHPMGMGGEGRHLSVILLAEILDYCGVSCHYSYDSGVTWEQGITYSIFSSVGYAIGQTIRLQWVPKRRKVKCVRVKITMQQDLRAELGLGRGLALFQCVLMFEDLAGPARLSAPQRGVYGT